MAKSINSSGNISDFTYSNTTGHVHITGAGGGGGGGSSNNTGNIQLTTGTSANTTASIGPDLTPEEVKRLENLIADRDYWIKQEKLNAFKKLPPHLRQRAVDEACMKEYLENVNNIDKSKFDGQDEIEKLESKNRNNMGFTFSGSSLSIDGTGSWYVDNSTSGMVEITNYFTKDELMDAHATVTLEESLTGDEDGL